MKNYFLILSVCLLLPILVNAQMPVGSWRDHLCYSSVKKVIRVGDKLYCATQQNVFIYNTTDNSYQKISTITGLSDVGVSNMAYYPEKDILFISYINGNIDLLHANKITNIADLKRKMINSKKGANHIFFNRNYAYCSYDFGIMVIDLVKNEIKDTYILGESGNAYAVNSIAIYDNYIYASTGKGIFKASVDDPFLIDFNRWIRQTNIVSPNRKFGNIANFQGKLIVNSLGEGAANDTLYILDNSVWSKIPVTISSGTRNITVNNNHMVVSCSEKAYVLDEKYEIVYTYSQFSPQDALIDDNSNLWIGISGLGLVKQPINSTEYTYYYPSGPGSNSIWNMKSSGNSILVSSGGVTPSWSGLSTPAMFFRYSDNTWYNIWEYGENDFISISGDPVDPEKFYLGAWGRGVFVYKKNALIDHYTDENSSIQNIFANDHNYMRIGGITFDQDNNMWFVNQQVAKPISVLKNDGTWKSLPFKISDVETLGDILCDINGNFWIVLPRYKGLCAFNINGTIDNADDDVLTERFYPKDAYGDLVKNVFCITNDKDGSVWVGTDGGPIVYTNPIDIFSGGTDGYQPTVSRNDGTTDVDALLGGESIYAIAIDGANRKWFGTEKGGAFLLSADGTKQILHFNTENSPLFSNFVRAIAIHPVTGEVFFGTDQGIISYRGVATEPLTDLSGAAVFPNPVRPEYYGNISISGLVENTSVKITDISGNLVYQTISQGGAAIWDGKNRSGSKAATGVYLIFLTNEDGTTTNVLKLLIIK